MLNEKYELITITQNCRKEYFDRYNKEIFIITDKVIRLKELDKLLSYLEQKYTYYVFGIARNFSDSRIEEYWLSCTEKYTHDIFLKVIKNLKIDIICDNKYNRQFSFDCEGKIYESCIN